MRLILNKHTNIFFYILILFFLTGCGLKREATFIGKTMGTTYHIKVVTWLNKDTDSLRGKIEQRLSEINSSMSIYMEDSEISRFNKYQTIDKNFEVSDDFIRVVAIGKRLYEITGGAWDATINPIVNIWGFGNYKKKRKIPSIEQIKKLKENIGFNYINISDEGHLVKKKGKVALDFGSIAKGYAVDELSTLILETGINDFIVEIGGEVYASGIRKDKKNWKVGINMPKKDASYNKIYKTVRLRGRALATSGDYRNFFEYQGKSYSHVLDPRTGWPVSNGVVSVSILAGSCAVADGLATAVTVMGHEKGIELVNSLDNIETLVVIQKEDGNLEEFSSAGFIVQ
jgi:thiamine biosynthesis lipoprotein